jgi:hypothetical protein
MRTISKEHRRKISESNRRRIVTEETKKRISNSLKGFHHSMKTKKKMSESRMGQGNSMWGKHQSDDTINKISQKAKERFKNINNHPRWKGGRRQHRIGGYVSIYSPNHHFKTKEGYVREHRLVMERYIGRYLKPEEVVHHINGIKDDNRKENLMLFKTDNIHKFFHKQIRH